MKINPTRIVSIDAGFRFMGVAVYSRNKIRETHLLSTGKGETRYVAEDYRNRLESLSSRLAAIIRKVKPNRVVAEMPTGASQSQRASSQMAMAFAAVVLTCHLLGVRLVMITPRELKMHVKPNSKKVSKADVIKFVTNLGYSELLPTNKSVQEHIADAIACLDCYLHRSIT